MTLEEIRQRYPVLAERLPAELFTERELLVVDENYEEADGEEAAEFEPSEYSHMLYIAEPMQQILGEEGLKDLTEKITASKVFEEVLISEKDLFGLQTTLDEAEIAGKVFAMIEEVLT